MGARAIHGIRLNVSNIDLAVQFYTAIGMVEDLGMRLLREGATSILSAQDPSGLPDARSVSLRWPCDPYMHLNLVGRTGTSRASGWPKVADQAGSTVVSLVVDDVDAETSRVRDAGGEVAVDPADTERLLGTTRSSFVLDPDGNVVELIQLAPAPAWDLTRASVFGAERSFLHFELNTDDLDTVSAFYAGFGFAHNPLNNVRPNATYDAPEVDPYVTAWGQSLMPHMAGVQFFRLDDDPSEMHLEIMGWKDGLQDPTDAPVWQQRGVMRYCFKTRDLAGTLADMQRRGVKIFMHDQRAGLAWGDSEWFYFADPDGNILTFEEWFPTGHWGERY